MLSFFGQFDLVRSFIKEILSSEKKFRSSLQLYFIHLFRILRVFPEPKYIQNSSEAGVGGALEVGKDGYRWEDRTGRGRGFVSDRKQPRSRKEGRL